MGWLISLSLVVISPIMRTGHLRYQRIGLGVELMILLMLLLVALQVRMLL